MALITECKCDDGNGRDTQQVAEGCLSIWIIHFFLLAFPLLTQVFLFLFSTVHIVLRQQLGQVSLPVT
jgi:hypothetical protein